MATRRTERPATRQRRGHGRVTLQDVAALAGCTAITVSRYLREPGKVADEMAARIRQALADTAYVPNRQAGLLASGQSGMVAALIPSIANSIFAESVQGLSDTLQAAGHELMLASTGYSLQREEELVRTVLGWAPAALVLTGRHHSPGTLALVDSAVAAGMPVVQTWDLRAQRPARGVVQVGFDHEAVGREMARRLLAAGHRDLAYVDSGVQADYRAHERGAGFVSQARRAKAQVLLHTAEPGDAFDSGRRALHDLLRPGAAPVTAAAFANDHLACGALLQARDLGVAVPGRLALVGFGDFPMGRQLSPGLTTVHPPRYEIGVEAARVLLRMLDTREPEPDRPLAWQWVQRGSAAG